MFNSVDMVIDEENIIRTTRFVKYVNTNILYVLYIFVIYII